LNQLNPDQLEILTSQDAARAQFDARELTAQEVIDLRHGKRIRLGQIDKSNGSKSLAIAGFAVNGELVAILENSGGQLKSRVVFQEETND